MFGKISEKLYFEIFGGTILNCDTQTSLFKDKNPGRESMAAFEFFERPKIIQNITLPKEEF